MDTSFEVEAVIGAGRGALVVAMFGAGWLGWGLGQARAFAGLVGPVFGAMALLLWIGSISTIRKGHWLRQRHPRVPASARHAARRSFVIIVLFEAVALAFVAILASWLHRPDLGTDWCAMVVGLHFLPLAKAVRSPSLIVSGLLITLWCVLSWVLFRSHTLVISVAVGTGILLWATSAVVLARARKIVHSLQ